LNNIKYHNVLVKTYYPELKTVFWTWFTLLVHSVLCCCMFVHYPIDSVWRQELSKPQSQVVFIFALRVSRLALSSKGP
jgi:hypothetical protein